MTGPRLDFSPIAATITWVSRSRCKGNCWSNFTTAVENFSGVALREKLSDGVGWPFKNTCTRSTSNQFGHWTRTESARVAPAAERSSPGPASRRNSDWGELDLEEGAAGHHDVAVLGRVDHVQRLHQGRIIGRALHVVPQPAGAMEVVVGVGVHHAGDSIALVQELKPVDDGVVVAAPAAVDRGLGKDCLDWVNFDDIHFVVHCVEAAVGRAVAVAVAEHPADVGMVDLNELFAIRVPQGEALDLGFGVGGGGGRAVVLCVGHGNEGKGVLVVEWKGLTGQLDADACRHSFLGSQAPQVRVVGRKAIVLGARGEFHVLAQQVQHSAELARSVVTGWAGMAVEIGTDPAVGFDRSDQLRLEVRRLRRGNVQPGEYGVKFRAMTDDHIIRAGLELASEAAVVAVEHVLHRMLAG